MEETSEIIQSHIRMSLMILLIGEAAVSASPSLEELNFAEFTILITFDSVYPKSFKSN